MTFSLEHQPHQDERPADRQSVGMIESERVRQRKPDHVDIDDLNIEVYDHPPFGLAICLRNTGLVPAENYNVLLTRVDRYVTSKYNDFTRNTCDPMTVLRVAKVDGQHPSDGHTFAITDLNGNSIRFDSAITEFRRSPSPQMTEGTWLLEFALKRKDEILKKQEFFVKWVPDSRPELTIDPPLIGASDR